MSIFFVAIGGALGAVVRFVVALWVGFPYGTLCVNVIGSFLMGVAFVWFSNRGASQGGLFVMTGFLGGFTTFSAFSLDVVKLMENGKTLIAGQYVLMSVLGSLLAIGLGVFVTRMILQ
ncbi:putative fluoride ion transporter CrcB [Amylibacter marinus]|uniref:Fluoride-specific ion channel FluC n=1 Tax=Amylibacter marinus TaxID=1475483 RepID=A0ABQ5VUW7_9RHOB|nr:CrcB family protein [Amylibacter marinus]GLQ35124.1 putative fluoride ion transporter CrcB [Amylibacter marinus]